LKPSPHIFLYAVGDGWNIVPILDFAKIGTVNHIDHHMTTPMADGLDDLLAFNRITSGSEGNAEAPLTGLQDPVRLVGVGIAKYGASVDKDLELSRHIAPVGGGRNDQDIGLVYFVDQDFHVIGYVVGMDAPAGVVTRPVPQAIGNIEIAQTE
jgi:hypothetical protein